MKPWVRILVEIVVIIFSILAAFSLEAWWQEHLENKQLHRLLVLVESELQENQRILEVSITNHERILKGIEKTIADKTLKENLFEALVNEELYQLNDASIQALISSGLIGDIDDEKILISLFRVISLSQDLREKEIRAIEFRDRARYERAKVGHPVYDPAQPEPATMLANATVINLLVMRQTEEQEALAAAFKLNEHVRSTSELVTIYLSHQ